MTEAMTEPYRLAADTLGPEEIAAAKAVFDSGYLTMGARVRAFEEEFAAWVGAQHAVMVNSGSSANLLIADTLLRGLTAERRLRPGDEVIVPGLSWPTTVWPLAQLGLTPVFADVDSETLAIDPESARSMAGPRTRAMFLIHPLGRGADMRPYLDLCAELDLTLMEDCCESLGAHFDGRHVGTFGALASFSFYFSHHISTIEGGMVITDDVRLADSIRGLRAHGWIRDRSDRAAWTEAYPDFDPRFLFATVGYNVRATEVQGALGSVQLRRLDEMLFAREALARAVSGWIAQFAPWLELIGGAQLASPVVPDRRARRHSWMTLPLRLSADAPLNRDQVVAHLEAAGVETRPIIAGNLARHPATREIGFRAPSEMQVCDALLRNSFMIGCHPVLSSGSLTTLERAITSLGAV